MELRLQLAAFFTPTDFVIFRQGHVENKTSNN